MLPRIPNPSCLVWCSEPLLGFKVANLLNGGGSHVGCLLASVGITKPMGATSPRINGKIASQSWPITGEGIDNPTGDVEIFAIDPDGVGLIRRTHIGEPSERREPSLVEGKP